MWLEKLIHPKVLISRKKFLQHCRRVGAKIVVIEIPLLLETGIENEFDHVVMTFAPKYLRKKRALKRDGMTSLRWRNINRRQMPDCKKKTKCNGVIISGLGKVVGRRSVVKSLYRFRKSLFRR